MFQIRPVEDIITVLDERQGCNRGDSDSSSRPFTDARSPPEWQRPSTQARNRATAESWLYLPREVFLGRFGFAAVFLSVCGSDFSRFLPAMTCSFPRRSRQRSRASPL